MKKRNKDMLNNEGERKNRQPKEKEVYVCVWRSGEGEGGEKGN